MSAQTVKIGETDVNVPRLTGFKAIRAGRILKEIGKKVPTIMEELASFSRKYEEENSVTVTREMARLPRYSSIGWTDEDFERNGGKITVPVSPSTAEQTIALFPTVFDAAETSVVELLALMVAENRALEDADDEDRVEEFLKVEGKKLLHRAEVDQLLELVIVVGEVLGDQFQGKVERLGNLVRLWQGSTSPQNPKNGQKKPSSKKKRESSIPSPVLTGGPEAEPSSESASGN